MKNNWIKLCWIVNKCKIKYRESYCKVIQYKHRHRQVYVKGQQ